MLMRTFVRAFSACVCVYARAPHMFCGQSKEILRHLLRVYTTHTIQATRLHEAITKKVKKICGDMIAAKITNNTTNTAKILQTKWRYCGDHSWW